MEDGEVRSLGPPLSTAEATHLERLFDTHSARLYRLARRLVSTPDDALDLVQETFVRAAGALQRLPVDTQAQEAWLIRVLVNHRRDQWRREAVRKRAHAGPRAHAEDLHDPEPALVAHAVVWQALERLTPRRRTVLVMHALEGESVATIAHLLGLSAITVRWHLARARGEVAHQLQIPIGATDGHADQTPPGRRPNPARTVAP